MKSKAISTLDTWTAYNLTGLTAWPLWQPSMWVLQAHAQSHWEHGALRAPPPHEEGQHRHLCLNWRMPALSVQSPSLFIDFGGWQECLSEFLWSKDHHSSLAPGLGIITIEIHDPGTHYVNPLTIKPQVTPREWLGSLNLQASWGKERYRQITRSTVQG